MKFKIKKSDDRAHLESFATAIDAVARISWDDCGDYALDGNDGHIYHVGLPGAPPCFQAMVGKSSPILWQRAKARVSFGRVSQDGDCEGSIMFEGLPTPAQGAILRDVLGLRKRPTLSAAQREASRQHALSLRARRSGLGG